MMRGYDLERLCAALRRTVALEIRSAGLVHEPDPYLPPPCDLKAEAEILSAVLDTHATPAELAPLEAKHFFADVHSATWTAVTECPPGDEECVLRVLTTRGWRGELAEELHRLELQQPWVCLPRLREHVVRLVDLWERRELLSLVHDLNIRLRRDTSFDEAVRRFEACILRLRP